MHTRCVRQGQVEVGVLEHEGREFAALGASVLGTKLTAYTKSDLGEIRLTSWCGKTMLVARSEIVEQYWSGSLARLFRLTSGRFIVGYALGEQGMLFRGELLTGYTAAEACQIAREISDRCAELDAEDEFESVEEG